MNNQKAFAEVVESSLSEWKAQVWDSENLAIFGSLVKVKSKDQTIFAIVYNIEIQSADPHRVITVYKREEAILKRDYPQIFEFLKTTLSCITVGYKEHKNDILIYQLAPKPPQIHSFVYFATQQETIAFFSDEQYLNLLFNFSKYLTTLDELLLAVLKLLSDNLTLKKDTVEKFINIFSILTGNDYKRLKIFLKRAKFILKDI